MMPLLLLIFHLLDCYHHYDYYYSKRAFSFDPIHLYHYNSISVSHTLFFLFYKFLWKRKKSYFLEGYIPYTQKQTQWMFSAIIIFLFFGGFREENVPTFVSSLCIPSYFFWRVCFVESVVQCCAKWKYNCFLLQWWWWRWERRRIRQCYYIVLTPLYYVPMLLLLPTQMDYLCKKKILPRKYTSKGE